MKKVQIDGLGEITFKKSARAKYIKLKVVPFERVVVTVPTYLNYDFGINAVMGRYDWLQSQLHKVREQENALSFKESDFPIHTLLYEIQIVRSTENVLKLKAVKNIIRLSIPEEAGFEDLAIQNFLSDSLNKVYRAEAKQVLPKKVKEYAVQYKLPVGKVTIRDTKTRWGSCSHENNISLSLHLMKLPMHIIDYVVLHELAHVTEKNHQKPFWELLDVYCKGNAKALDRELKNYNHLILR